MRLLSPLFVAAAAAVSVCVLMASRSRSVSAPLLNDLRGKNAIVTGASRYCIYYISNVLFEFPKYNTSRRFKYGRRKRICATVSVARSACDFGVSFREKVY